jgi:hypothetical protein
MEVRVVLSTSPIHSKAASIAASEQGPTQLERRILDGLNATLEPDLTFSPAARQAMTRIPFSFRNDVNAYKVKLRGNKVAFKESGSIVVIKGTTSGDIQSSIDDVVQALVAYRRRNRAYASHTAAGVLIDPSSGTIRVLTFRPLRPAARPSMAAGRALAGSDVVRSVGGLAATPSGVATGLGEPQGPFTPASGPSPSRTPMG